MLWLIYQNQCNEQWIQSFQVWFWFEFQFKKLVISSKVIKEIKIIFLCKLNEILSEENYFEKLFLIDAHFILQN